MPYRHSRLSFMYAVVALICTEYSRIFVISIYRKRKRVPSRRQRRQMGRNHSLHNFPSVGT